MTAAAPDGSGQARGRPRDPRTDAAIMAAAEQLPRALVTTIMSAIREHGG